MFVIGFNFHPNTRWGSKPKLIGSAVWHFKQQRWPPDDPIASYPPATSPLISSPPPDSSSLGSLIGWDHVAFRVPLCVWFETGPWGLFCFNLFIYFNRFNATSPVAYERWPAMLWLDLKKPMFRLLIGTWGSDFSWPTEPFSAITFYLWTLITDLILLKEKPMRIIDLIVGITGWIYFDVKQTGYLRLQINFIFFRRFKKNSVFGLDSLPYKVWYKK